MERFSLEENYQGKEKHFQNAEYLFIDKKVQIHADALENGPGGKIIFWADEATGFFGTTTATGGTLEGDGGFVEISSKGLLCPEGYVDTTAPFGKVGTLLLDPTDVTIDTIANNGISAFPPPGYTFSAASANISTVVATTLQTFLGTNDVTINTANGFGGTGTIRVLSGFTWASGRALTMIADASITFLSSITSSSGVLPASQTVLDLRAPIITVGKAGAVNDTVITCSSGRIDVQASTSLNILGGPLGAIPAQGILQTSGDINIFNTRDVNILGGRNLIAPATLQSFSGDININMSGNLTISGGTSTGTSNAVINVAGGDSNITMAGANTMCTLTAGSGAGAPASICSPKSR